MQSALVPDKTGRPRRWLRMIGIRLAAVTVASLVAVILAEIVVRVAGLGADQLLRSDPLLGVRFIPATRGLSQGPCYSTEVTTNSQGWRSPEFTQAKPAGVLRVLVLGDSFMAGVQVDDNQTFARVLESRLRTSGIQRQVEVINLGVPSWGTDQEYVALREFGRALDPDLVVLAFYAQNDVSDNDVGMRLRVSRYLKPYFKLENGGLVEVPLVESTPASIRLARRLTAPWRLYPLVRDGLISIPAAHRLLYALDVIDVVPSRETRREFVTSPRDWPERWNTQTGVFESPVSTDWARGWQITEALLGKVDAESRAGGARLLVLQLPSPLEVMPPELRAQLTRTPGLELDVDLPTARLAGIAGRLGLDVVSLVPVFRERIGADMASFEALYLKCDGHWTATGHLLAALSAMPEIAARLNDGRQP